MKNIAYIGSWKHFVFVFVCVWVSLSLYLSSCKSSSRSMSSPDDKLSENIWFAWSRISYGGLGSTSCLSFSVYGCLCLCICLFVSLRLGHYHHQMISFQKIYGLYGLEHQTAEINGDVTVRTDGWTNKQTNKQVNIELLGQWTVSDWVSQCTFSDQRWAGNIFLLLRTSIMSISIPGPIVQCMKET